MNIKPGDQVSFNGGDLTNYPYPLPPLLALALVAGAVFTVESVDEHAAKFEGIPSLPWADVDLHFTALAPAPAEAPVAPAPEAAPVEAAPVEAAPVEAAPVETTPAPDAAPEADASTK